VCSPAAIGPAVGAIGNAAGISAENKAKKRAYDYKLKVRERKWMQQRTTYKSKKVQFEQQVDLANIAAQRAYSEINKKIYDARSLAILQNQSDFLKMIKNQGDIMASAAERGVSGKSLAKMLVTNQASLGMQNAMRARGLTMAMQRAKAGKEDIRTQLKSDLNRAFSRVALQPVQDIAPPPPVMGNPGMALMMGMANAVSAGIGGMDSNTMGTGGLDASASASQASTISAGTSMGYGADTFYTGIPSGSSLPAGAFGYTTGVQPYYGG
tara:strand:+ start:37 stop:840 length:804 start_codon:yes stop_codon:yes gene_type:complete